MKELECNEFEAGVIYNEIALVEVKETVDKMVRIWNPESLLINFRGLHMLQLDFLRILCSHEHLTALNLPIFFDQAKNRQIENGL